ncbi:MerR family DNA-binding transcriptional regulator [bacterium C-53]|nr:MerR family DNA-binding transcriptional regulator [Lachnospiraceae bacterium]NBI04931.1 MerR family DNA-binding transcriptional regulator [Lachnospiraceae bacterium]RKJ07586.1 MerR family DNA-binding transcriptional regulator [bacterium C-53]
MRTISQVAELTGISTRTLQYYDEIGLLKPSELTESGYRLYDDEAEVAKLAIQQFSSIEKYTEAMKHNLEHFSELMETQLTEEVKEIGKQSDILYGRLTTDLSEDVSSPKIQSIVHELLQLIQKNSTSVSLDKPYINILIDTYSGDYIKSITDSKYGKGASDYIVKAFRYYLENNAYKNN